jgi:type IV pilus assembly protein PilE
MAQARTAAGFTLIELVVALAVVAVTTMIAASTYRGHVLRSHRIAAVQALLVVAAEQEKFHLSNGTYGDRLDARAGDVPPGIPVASRTPGGHYALSVTAADAAAYRVVAIAVSASADPMCRVLSIDESGRRAASDSRGADTTGRCW